VPALKYIQTEGTDLQEDMSSDSIYHTLNVTHRQTLHMYRHIKKEDL